MTDVVRTLPAPMQAVYRAAMRPFCLSPAQGAPPARRMCAPRERSPGPGLLQQRAPSRGQCVAALRRRRDAARGWRCRAGSKPASGKSPAPVCLPVQCAARKAGAGTLEALCTERPPRSAPPPPRPHLGAPRRRALLGVLRDQPRADPVRAPGVRGRQLLLRLRLPLRRAQRRRGRRLARRLALALVGGCGRAASAVRPAARGACVTRPHAG